MANYLVTGANRGIGLEFVKQLLARGETVIASCRRPAEATALKAPDGAHDKLRVMQLDVGDDASAERLAADLAGTPIDVLINNAGVGSFTSLEDADTRKMLDEYDTNALGPLRVTRALLRNLRAGEHKKVASITSLMGSITDNASGSHYGYRMSKAALNMASKSLSIDLKPEGFTVVVLNPGWVKTDMGGSGANLSVEQSVKGLLAVIDGLTQESSGHFYHYDGRELPW